MNVASPSTSHLLQERLTLTATTVTISIVPMQNVHLFSFTYSHSFIPKSAALLIRPQSHLAVDRAVACLAYLSPEVSQAR